MRSTKGKAMGAAFLGIPVVIAWVASGLATACTSSAVTPCDLADCTETGPGPDVSIPDAGKDADPIPTGCDTPTAPGKNPEKCLTDEFGAYVAPNGNDANPGTKALPYKTIGKALSGDRSRIVVCEGSYEETLTVVRSAELYGGVTCTFDKAGGKAKIAPAASTGLTVGSGTLKLFDVEVIAKSATEPGASSVGIFAKAGTVVEIARGRVEARDGADGADAKATGDNRLDKDPTGAPASGATGGIDKKCTCSIHGESTGGSGGDGGKNLGAPAGAKGGNGLSMPTTTPVGIFTGEGGAGEAALGDSCRNGRLGAPGTARQGGAGAKDVGAVTAMGWKTRDGASGESGNPGQGGGGGGGSYFNATSAGGGGGGCGGCGGAGGFGGGGGGASIAVLALDAMVLLQTTELKTGKGGVGKAGGTGQAVSGGGGGAGTVGACSGAAGGPGAGGGGGGGGAGGSSLGIGYTGVAPKIDGQAVDEAEVRSGISVGARGAGGAAGMGGAGYTAGLPNSDSGGNGTAGADGAAKAVLKVGRE
jgi:hypothetical protein